MCWLHRKRFDCSCITLHLHTDAVLLELSITSSKLGCARCSALIETSVFGKVAALFQRPRVLLVHHCISSLKINIQPIQMLRYANQKRQICHPYRIGQFFYQLPIFTQKNVLFLFWKRKVAALRTLRLSYITSLWYITSPYSTLMSSINCWNCWWCWALERI